jgi:hypothetical protein
VAICCRSTPLGDITSDGEGFMTNGTTTATSHHRSPPANSQQFNAGSRERCIPCTLPIQRWMWFQELRRWSSKFQLRFDRSRSSNASGCFQIGLRWTTDRPSIAVATAATRCAERVDCLRVDKGGGLENLPLVPQRKHAVAMEAGTSESALNESGDSRTSENAGDGDVRWSPKSRSAARGVPEPVRHQCGTLTSAVR